MPPSNNALGTAAYDLTSPGQGRCAGTSLGQAISAVHAGWPALADIAMLYDPSRLGDGSFIYAFTTDDSFQLVFKRGGGDCPAGCTENEYWYFQTGAGCVPTEAGHFKAAWGPDCLVTVGAPMWGLPKAPDPGVVCGADNSPQNVSGTYQLQGTGHRVACTDKAGAEPSVDVTLPLTLVVAQTAGDLAHGTVTLQGTGHPLVDGQPVPATFTRRRFTALRMTSNLPSTCIAQNSLQLDLDFESGGPGRLEFTEVNALDCPPSQAYCKGLLSLELALQP